MKELLECGICRQYGFWKGDSTLVDGKCFYCHFEEQGLLPNYTSLYGKGKRMLEPYEMDPYIPYRSFPPHSCPICYDDSLEHYLDLTIIRVTKSRFSKGRMFKGEFIPAHWVETRMCKLCGFIWEYDTNLF